MFLEQFFQIRVIADFCPAQCHSRRGAVGSLLSDILQLWNVPSISLQVLCSPSLLGRQTSCTCPAELICACALQPSPPRCFPEASDGMHVCKEQLTHTVWVVFARTGGYVVHLSSEAWLNVHETQTNTEEHQVVRGHGYHMERMMCCPEWKDLFLRQWSFTLLTHTHTQE